MNGRCHPPPPPQQSIGQHRSKPTDHPAPTTTDRSVVGYGGRTTDEWMGDTSLWHHRTLSVSLSVSVTHSSCVCLSSLSLMSDQSIPNFSEYLSMSVSVNFSPLIPSSSLHLPSLPNSFLFLFVLSVCVSLPLSFRQGICSSASVSERFLSFEQCLVLSIQHPHLPASPSEPASAAAAPAA